MTKSLRRRAPLWAALVPMLIACGDDSVTPAAPKLEILVAGGDGQYGTSGQQLPSPLQAAVRRVDTGAPQEGVAVSWTVESGSATLVTSAIGTTNAQGLVNASLQLGTSAGAVGVRASLRDQEGTSVAFQAFVAERPLLASLDRQAVRGGDTVRIRGSGFSPTPVQNVVLFSGIRGRVLTASSEEMAVEVPRCLPGRVVDVTAQLGALVSTPLSLMVSDGGQPTSFSAGVPVDVEDPAGFGCLRLPGGQRYLVVVQSAGTVGAAEYPFSLRGLSSAGPVSMAATAPPAHVEQAHLSLSLQFERSLREEEARWVREGVVAGLEGGPMQAAPRLTLPSVGSRRSFKVLNGQGRFDDVQATVRLVSDQSVLYVDDASPSGGFTAAELTDFADTFDDLIYPTVTQAFGVPSDLDGNARVAVLFTPAVNRLTPANSDGFVGGFFYGLDLLDRDGSNHGEVFYAVVPDSAGRFSDPRPRDLVLRVVPGILAHEFQHMVHFNERVLKRGADGTEALWLSEGMAQMAEELVARALEAAGDDAGVEEYRSGNRSRARRYLASPGAVSLIVSTGQGSLEERGAGWLHTLYLWDRYRGDELLSRLTQTTLTGTANVAAATGRTWPDLLADWSAALYADGLGGIYPFEYPSVSLRDFLRGTGPYPLAPETLGASDFTRSGSLWSSSARHYIVVPPASGFAALRLGGEAGGNAPTEAALRLRVVLLYP